MASNVQSETDAATPDGVYQHSTASNTYRHKWLKPLDNGRVTNELVGTGGTLHDTIVEDDEEEYEYDEALSSVSNTDEEDGDYRDPKITTGNPGNGIHGHCTVVRCKSRVRKLVPWHKDRSAEQFLLHLQYETFQAGIDLPWEEAMQRFQPGCGGYNAMKQQFAKWREVLIAEGHMVPPPMKAMAGGRQRGGDKVVRGYVRDLNNPSPTATKQLLFTESWVHRNKSLDIPDILTYGRVKDNATIADTDEDDHEPPAKKQRPSKAPAVLAQSIVDHESTSGSEYNPKEKSSSQKRQTKRAGRRSIKYKPSQASYNRDIKTEGSLVKVNHGLATIHLPSNALLEVSQRPMQTNNFQSAHYNYSRGSALRVDTGSMDSSSSCPIAIPAGTQQDQPLGPQMQIAAGDFRYISPKSEPDHFDIQRPSDTIEHATVRSSKYHTGFSLQIPSHATNEIYNNNDKNLVNGICHGGIDSNADFNNYAFGNDGFDYFSMFSNFNNLN
ncbi:hypothetical protein BJ878DRAFT_483065 [Calycina marina]|uniref:Uncharacterized protein n=1 Tax=Calycina marina TaxID=1763456 RepID=A0A9P7YX17_9HELO|nr:hypothetical protein BJ878DRAFT_483065 [Calycina marina]